MKDLEKWVEQAEKDIHYNGLANCSWQEKFLELYAQYQRANKIIDRLL